TASRHGPARCSTPVSRTRCGAHSPAPSRRRRARPSASTRSSHYRGKRRLRRSSCGHAATPRISASGCGGYRASLWSRPIALRVGSPMTSSRWHAYGNVYLVAEDDDYTMDPDLDGVLRVLDVDGDDVHVAIVNPDGSLAEMSGNGTRIAAAWLIARRGSTLARVHVGSRVVEVHRVAQALYESDLGDVEVAPKEVVDGYELTPVSVGNPHAVLLGDPADLPEVGPILENHPRFPNRTNVQIAHVDGPG